MVRACRRRWWKALSPLHWFRNELRRTMKHNRRERCRADNNVHVELCPRTRACWWDPGKHILARFLLARQDPGRWSRNEWRHSSCWIFLQTARKHVRWLWLDGHWRRSLCRSSQSDERLCNHVKFGRFLRERCGTEAPEDCWDLGMTKSYGELKL